MQKPNNRIKLQKYFLKKIAQSGEDLERESVYIQVESSDTENWAGIE